MKIQNLVLSADQIDAIAEYAANNWQLSCDWNRARESAYDYAVDEYCAILDSAQIAAVIRRACDIVDSWRESARVKKCYY